VVPLFLLMGQFATHGGLSKSLFKAGNAMIGHWRGGMAMGAVGACAGFGAICGSSLATAATMGQVALPELKAHGYSERLSAAAIAAGGTLGILIPPSVPLVIYAIITEQNIAKMFLAAFVPGILAAVGYMVVIGIVARVSPKDAPAGTKFSFAQRLKALSETWPVILIFITVIGGIYGGIFTPTEAASIGTLATGLVAWTSGGLKGRGFLECMYGAAGATGMIFLILLGADPGTHRARQLGDWPGPAAIGCVDVHHRDLLGTGLHHGQLVYDFADHPDLLPHDHGYRPVGYGYRGQGHLVRDLGPDGGRGWPNYAPRWHERVHHQRHGQERANEGDLQSDLAIFGVGHHSDHLTGVLPGHRADRVAGF
jgi:hypothetical protein